MTSFPEIVICDLAQFQLVIPSRSPKYSSFNSRFNASYPKRQYCDRGWLFYAGALTGTIQSLRLSALTPVDSPFKISPRIAHGVPLSFEVRASQPLPNALAAQALFLYQFQQELTHHYALFQNLIPRFVRIYPWKAVGAIAAQVNTFLNEEQEFLTQHHARLKHLTFYKTWFDL